MLLKWFYIISWVWCVQVPPVFSGKLQLGTPEQCKSIDFVPGYNLGGEGFDIVKMERKDYYVIDMEKWDRGNGTCAICQNIYAGGAKQKLPVGVEHWRTEPHCSLKITSRIYESSEALINDSTSSVSNNWKVGLNLPMVAGVSFGGSHSRDATYAASKSKTDKSSFTKHEMKCSYYRYVITRKPPLHKDFLQTIEALPKSENPQAYKNLIDTYGTHYTTKVTLGGEMKAITAIKSCQASMSGLTDTAVKDCLDVEASGTHKSLTLKAEFQRCQELKKKMGTQQSFSSMFNDHETEIIGGNINGGALIFSIKSQPDILTAWLESLKTIPGVVTYSLKPLHLLLDKKHPARRPLQTAVEKYIKDNALKKVCSEKCKIGRQCSARDRCACVCNRSKNIHSNCCPAGRGLATLKVYGLRAKGLYGDVATQTDGSVKVSYGPIIKRTEVINNNDNPTWPETFEFGPIQISMATKLTFQVYDADSYWNSDLLGTCSFDLRSGKVSDTCFFKYGTFFFSYSVQCAPSLGGPQCNEYAPSPMEPSLAKIFHSRNGILAKDLWKLELGRNYTDELRVKTFKGKEFSRM
ncbi:perforin-1-like [Chanos chanos]|uniref:Perforin-1-like n=1 Tax=Chanos chanos TaxID=29144 RepID=A0A6J2WP96_CHACN|nr:perforin-1-like [Chanos chanos]